MQRKRERAEAASHFDQPLSRSLAEALRKRLAELREQRVYVLRALAGARLKEQLRGLLDRLDREVAILETEVAILEGRLPDPDDQEPLALRIATGLAVVLIAAIGGWALGI